MKKRMVICLLGITMIANTLSGCGKKKTNEAAKSNTTKEEWQVDGVYTAAYYLDNCKNSTDGRYLNFICFSDDETVAAIKTLKIDIIVNKETVESYEVSNSQMDDIYCISPLIEKLPEDLEFYEVKFTANDTYTWTRNFSIVYSSEELLVNTILLDDQNGFDSVLAG